MVIMIICTYTYIIVLGWCNTTTFS